LAGLRPQVLNRASSPGINAKLIPRKPEA